MGAVDIEPMADGGRGCVLHDCRVRLRRPRGTMWYLALPNRPSSSGVSHDRGCSGASFLHATSCPGPLYICTVVGDVLADSQM
jgi:hypothetical protein